jgi:prepilin-type N-terminal cleavage/methylation domain-containing protein
MGLGRLTQIRRKGLSGLPNPGDPSVRCPCSGGSPGGWDGAAGPGAGSTKGPISVLKHLRARTEGKTLLEKGFTLVELLVVIVILGILAAVVVFAVGGTEANAKQAACKSEKATVEAAYEAYRAQDLGDNPSIGDLVGAKLLKRDPKYVTGIDGNGNATGCSSGN